MQLASRPSIIAGVAIAGASLIVVTPMARHLPDVKAFAVQLTSGSPDPITAIEEVFKLAVTNAEDISDHFAPAPLPTLQQLIADPASFDLSKVETAAINPFLPTGPDVPDVTAPPAFLYPSLDGIHKF